MIIEMECGTLEIIEHIIVSIGEVIIGKLTRDEGEFKITYDCDEKVVIFPRWFELGDKVATEIEKEAAECFEWIKDAV